MGLEELRMEMKKVLSNSRYHHSLGVEEECCKLALAHGEDIEKAGIAGLLHDCAKYLSGEEILRECERYQINITDAERSLPGQLLHSKLGAVYAKEKYGVFDEDILKAIEFHTTGRPAMSRLEKILFIADYIEPNRPDIPNIDYIREVANEDLDKTISIITNQTLEYLKIMGFLIDPTTKEKYDYYVNQ